jgi:phosphatidylinositol alpha-mannosyltransferase
MRPLRIALVHPFSWPAVRRGGERYLADLVWYLSERAGHTVEVITGGPASETDGAAAVRRVPNPASARLERRGLTQVETFGIPALVPLLRRRYDVVHALTPSGAVASRLAGQRTVYTVLGYPAPELVSTMRPIQRRLMERAVRSAHVTAALSAAAAAAVEECFDRHAEVLSPGVRLATFTPNLEPRSGAPRLLFPSYAANPHKGLATILKSMGSVLRSRPDTTLELAGPGDARWALDNVEDPAIRRAVIEAGVGELDDLPRRYRETTVTVLPSIYEAFGLVLVESLASGTPVVCSRTSGGMAEIADRPEVGRTVPYDDAGALAGAISETIELARDPATPPRCAEHARRWGWEESIGPTHVNLYSEVAGKDSKRGAR